MSTDTEINSLEDAEKAFAEAFNKEIGERSPTTHVVVDAPDPVEVPAVVEPEATPVVADVPAPVGDTPPVTTEEVKPATRNDIPDWAQTLSPEVQDKIAGTIRYHNQRYNSDIGRQSAYQKQLSDARRVIADLQTKVATKPQDDSLAAAARKDQAKTAEEWKQLNEADPSLAKAVDSRLDERVSAETAALREELAGVRQQIKATVDPLYQRTEQDHLDTQHRILLDAVPNYQEVVNHPVYAYWINQKASPGIRQLANTSSDANDAINIFQMYSQSAPSVYEEMVNKGLLPRDTSVVTDPARTVQQPVSQDAATALADKVAKSREEKVQAAPVVRQAPNPIATPRVNALAGGKAGDAFDIDSPEAAALFADVFNKNVRR